MRRIWLALAACLTLVLASGAAATASNAAEQAPAGDAPPGFWWGSDSWPIPVSGSAPYSMPRLGGAYGGYIGMTGNWAYGLGCRGQEHFIAFSAANAAQAHTDFVTYHRGIGDGAYWFMGGPGVDPHYNGTAAEASAWGARQAARALADIANGHFDYPVVWADIELPGIGPAPTGWCLKSGGCAQFFGGQTSSSKYALMWQWSGGGGVSNGVGDFDQIDGARLGG